MDPLTVITGFIVVSTFGILSIKVKIVDTTGLIAGLIVGLSVFIFGGWKWFIIILLFHLITGQFTKYKYEQKRKRGVAEEKGGARNWQNVMANGGIATIFSIAEASAPLEIFFIGFLGAVSTATADTLATEIGLLYPHKPRLITDLRRKVTAGTSGAISPLGELATILGSALIGFVAWVLGTTKWNLATLLGLTLAAGIIGCTLDSLMGATIQAMYRCPMCGKITERTRHCGKSTIFVKGKKVVGNNIVNFVSTAFGSMVAILIFHFAAIT